MSRYQKGKTNLDFAEARDSEWQWHHLGHMLQTMPALHHSVFYRLDALLSHVKALKVKALKATSSTYM